MLPDCCTSFSKETTSAIFILISLFRVNKEIKTTHIPN